MFTKTIVRHGIVIAREQVYDTSVFLQITALPIGNYRDISARAREALLNAEVIVCEDTRKLKRLLQDLEIKSPSEFFAAPAGRVAEIDWAKWCKERQGKKVVLVSDAGTPMINDPGHQLLRAAKEMGATIQGLPGPCAPILAYQMTGGFGLPFIFAGFVPKKHIKEFFLKFSGPGTLAFFDTKHQYKETIQVLKSLGWGSCQAVVARELTKTHEEVFECSVCEIDKLLEARQLEQSGSLGELTFLVELKEQKAIHSEVNADLLIEMRVSSTKEAAKLIAKLTGDSTKSIYQKIVEKQS